MLSESLRGSHILFLDFVRGLWVANLRLYRLVCTARLAFRLQAVAVYVVLRPSASQMLLLLILLPPLLSVQRKRPGRFVK